MCNRHNGEDEFSNDNLSSTILGSSEFINYKQKIEQELKNEVSKIESKTDKISDIDPGVVSFTNNGALFSWHGTSEIVIDLKTLVINCDKFSYEIDIKLTDHFGLDSGDFFNEGLTESLTRTAHGMRSWFILQRVRGLKPFKSSVTTIITDSDVNF